MKLIVIRHGKAKHNLGDESKHTFAGSSLDNELTEDGAENAKTLAEKISEIGKCDIIYSSDLKRTIQTAEIIKNVLGLDAKHIMIPELAEVNVGDFVGHTKSEVCRLYPNAAKAFYDGDIKNWDFPNGENFNMVECRIKKAIELMKKDIRRYKFAVLSGHAMCNRIMFYLYCKNNEKLWKPTEYYHNRLDIINLR